MSASGGSRPVASLLVGAVLCTTAPGCGIGNSGFCSFCGMDVWAASEPFSLIGISESTAVSVAATANVTGLEIELSDVVPLEFESNGYSFSELFYLNNADGPPCFATCGSPDAASLGATITFSLQVVDQEGASIDVSESHPPVIVEFGRQKMEDVHLWDSLRVDLLWVASKS